jgi:hypothetical protein
VKLLSWSAPKQAHKKMVSRAAAGARAPDPLLPRRGEDRHGEEENGKTKTKIVPKEGTGGFKGWLPICEKNLPYELTASFLLTGRAAGRAQPIKLQEQHRALFPLDKPITEETGALRIAAWAAAVGFSLLHR